MRRGELTEKIRCTKRRDLSRTTTGATTACCHFIPGVQGQHACSSPDLPMYQQGYALCRTPKHSKMEHDWNRYFDLKLSVTYSKSKESTQLVPTSSESRPASSTRSALRHASQSPGTCASTAAAAPVHKTLKPTATANKAGDATRLAFAQIHTLVIPMPAVMLPLVTKCGSTMPEGADKPSRNCVAPEATPTELPTMERAPQGKLAAGAKTPIIFAAVPVVRAMSQ